MNNQIQIFSNPEFGNVRTSIDAKGEPLFCGADVCKALGYANPRKALADHVEERDVTKRYTPTKNQYGADVSQQMTFVNESGLYALIFSSKLEKAKEFKHWVTSEVLPSIRQHGTYLTPETIERTLLNPDFIVRLAMQLKDERRHRMEAEAKANELEEKSAYTNVILQCKTLVNVTQIAQDYGFSGMAFNKMLSRMNIQYKCGEQWVLFASYKNLGYVQSQTIHISDNMCRMRTMWTQRGRFFLYEELKKHGVLPLIEQKASNR